MPELPTPDSVEELTLRKTDLRDRLDEMARENRQLLWTVPIAGVVSTLVMSPSDAGSAIVVFGVTVGILSAFAWMVLGRRRRERLELSRELEEVEGRLAEGTGEGSLPRTDPTEGRRPGLG